MIKTSCHDFILICMDGRIEMLASIYSHIGTDETTKCERDLWLENLHNRIPIEIALPFGVSSIS